MSNSVLAANAQEYCFLWIDPLCAPLEQWPGWLQVIVAVVAIVVPIMVDAFRRIRSDATKVRNIEPTILTVAHYIEQACVYAETDNRAARMDITIDKLQRVLGDLNDMKPFDSPNPTVAKAVNLLKIAVGRAMSGLSQWLQNTEHLSRSGLQDLQAARKVSCEALALLGVKPGIK